MQTLTRTEFFAKPEVKEALKKLKTAAREALPATSFAEREVAMLAIFEEAQRGMIDEDLQDLAAGFGELLLIGGVEYKQHEPGLVQYYCLGGTIRVRRCTYRRVAVRNGPTVVPLELVAGLAEGATPALAYNVLLGYGQRDMRQHGEALVAAHRVPPARATLERMAKRLANVAHQAAHVSSRSCVKQKDSGTVSSVDEHGEALVTRRYAAPACDDPVALVTRMTADVRAAVRRDPRLAVSTVQDGAPEMWALTRAASRSFASKASSPAGRKASIATTCWSGSARLWS